MARSCRTEVTTTARSRKNTNSGVLRFNILIIETFIPTEVLISILTILFILACSESVRDTSD